MAPTALKVKTPGSLSRDEAVSLIRDQVAGFGTPGFQAKLEDLCLRYFRAAPGKERNKLNAERSKLSLEVQGKVLPEYGFSGDAKGVFQSWQAMQQFMQDDMWLLAAGLLNLVLGQDAQGQLLDRCRPATPRTYSEGAQDATSLRDGETSVSRFTALTSLDGLFPCSVFSVFDQPCVHGDAIIATWQTGIVVLTFDFEVRWRWKVESALHVAPLGSRLFATNNEGFAFCFCLETGAELWRRRYTSSPHPPTARTVATEAAGGLYLVCGHVEGTQPVTVDTIYALSLADGSEVWRTSLAPCVLIWCCPAVAGERVVIKDNLGCVSCLSLTTGALQWFSPGERGLKQCHMSPAPAAVSLKCGLVCVCRIPANEPSWNQVAGGAGILVALDLETGRKRWDETYELEVQSSPVILAEKRVVVVGLGNRCGPPEGLEGTKVAGDYYFGVLVGISTLDGSRIWTWCPPAWTKPTCSGCSAEDPSYSLAYQSVVPWTNLVAGSDGTIYTVFHSGMLYILNGLTGEVLDTFNMVWASTKGAACTTVLVAENTLVLVGLKKVHLFRRPQPGPSIEKPLVVPFQESGVGHFWPSKNCRNDHTLTTTSKGPVDLQKPAWAFEMPRGNRTYPFMNGCFYTNPVIDAQRNIYNMTEFGMLYVHRPDGSLRGSRYLGARVTTPVIDGTTLYAANMDGFALAMDMETLEFLWVTRYADCASQDTWMPSLGKDVVIFGGSSVNCAYGEHPIWKNQIPTKDWESNWHVFALDRKTGQHRWAFTPIWMVYNLNPTFIMHEGRELAIIMDSWGGFYFVACDSGEALWARPPIAPQTFNDICGVAMGPNKLIYVGSQDPTVPPPEWRNIGRYPQQPGVVEAFDVSSFPPTKRWEVKMPFEGMLQPVVVPVGDDKNVLVLPMGRNGAFPSVFPEPTQPDKFQGMIYGLNADTGEELWSFSPPPWMTETSSCRGSFWWCMYLPASWGSPVVDGRGTLHIYWCSGLMYMIEAATGRVKSSYDLGCSVTGSAAVAPGLVVIQAQYRVLVWRDDEAEEQWLEEAERAGDPRASLGRVGFGTSEEARQRGIGWGLPELLRRPPPEAEDIPNKLKLAASQPDSTQSPEAKPDAEPTAKPEGKQEAEPKEKDQPAKGGQRHTVVGGAKSGGISVRAGSGLKTEELGRLATGAVIRELAVAGDRIQYEKLSGEGPERGWVSKVFKGTALLSPVAD